MRNIFDQICPKCGLTMKPIPIKKLDHSMIIELYCEKCDESVTLFLDRKLIRFEPASFF